MPPLSVMIKPVSGACDLRCRYCFYADVSEHRAVKNYGIMSEDTAEKLVRRAFSYADGSVSFAFQGGEPLLRGLPFFRNFVSLVKRYNARRIPVYLSIQTNGMNLTPEFAAFFREAGFLVGLSMDGTQELHDRNRPDADGGGTYTRVKRAAEILGETGCEFNILTVVSRDIALRPDEVFDELKGYGFLQFIPLIDGFDGETADYSVTPETYGQFLIRMFDRYERAWKAGKPVSIRIFDNWLQMLLGAPAEHCGLMGVCGIYYLIEADGSVYPCDFYVLDEWRMGNIRTDSFHVLAANETGKAFREMSVKKPAECLSCRWYGICRGGCRRDREPFDNGCFGINRFCESYRTFFDARFDEMRKMARAVAEGARR